MWPIPRDTIRRPRAADLRIGIEQQAAVRIDDVDVSKFVRHRVPSRSHCSGKKAPTPPRNNQSNSERRAEFTPHSTMPVTRSGCRSPYASPSALPHEPPVTSQRSTPRCSRSRSMSAIRFGVVLFDRSMSGSLACGVLRPQFRWSNRTIRYASGSNSRGCHDVQPEPGPPCSTTAGLPSGFPQASQYTSSPSPTSSIPCSYGWISGYVPPTAPAHASTMTDRPA